MSEAARRRAQAGSSRGAAQSGGAASSLSFRGWEQREKLLSAGLLGPSDAESKVPRAQGHVADDLCGRAGGGAGAGAGPGGAALQAPAPLPGRSWGQRPAFLFLRGCAAKIPE